MKFNLKTLLSSLIALALALVLSRYQDITWVKVVIFTLIGYVLIIFGLGMRDAIKNLTSSKDDKDKKGNP